MQRQKLDIFLIYASNATHVNQPDCGSDKNHKVKFFRDLRSCFRIEYVLKLSVKDEQVF